MDVNGYTSSSSSATHQSDHEDMMMMDLRRGPWTVEEDLALINYIATHGEGRWNSLARCAGLKRTGKSCRLRWLNYLRPDVRRGNITLEEQLIILELHSRWGNRWSKIAQHLPGRTDNEIKNYWRTRVQKHAKQLQCDVNSKQFKDTMRYLWMPRLVERIQAATAASAAAAAAAAPSGSNGSGSNNSNNIQEHSLNKVLPAGNSNEFRGSAQVNPCFTPENSSTGGSSDSLYGFQANNNHVQSTQNAHGNYLEWPTSSSGYYCEQGFGFGSNEQDNMWMGSEDMFENSWNVEDLWFLQQQFNNGM